MDKLRLEVVTPEGVIVSTEADMVAAPGTEGEFGVLPGHINFLSGILPGELRYNKDHNTEYLAVNSGFVEVSDNRVSVLVDSAENANDIDVERARSAMERAKKRLKGEYNNEEIDAIRAESALKRAVSRLKVANKAI